MIEDSYDTCNPMTKTNKAKAKVKVLRDKNCFMPKTGNTKTNRETSFMDLKVSSQEHKGTEI